MAKPKHTKQRPKPNTKQHHPPMRQGSHTPQPQRLPHTILARIFTLIAGGPAILPPSPYDARLRLSLICSDWRAVVLSTESLWCKVVFTPPLTMSRNIPRLKILIDTWLARSRNTPLLLDALSDVWGPPGATRREFLNPEFFWRIFVPLLRRARVVGCILDKSSARTFLNFPPNALSPALEKITVVVAQSPMPRGKNMPIRIFEASSFPQLKSVEIQLLHRKNPLDVSLPWGQLTNLALMESVSPTTCMTILHKTSHSLVSCWFRIEFTPPTPVSRLTDPLYKVRMPKLKKLGLALITPRHDTRMFSLLKLPAVEAAVIESHDDLGWTFAPLISLFKRSKKLKHLVLKDPRYVAPQIYKDVDNLFAAVPSVEKLTLPMGIILDITTIHKLGEGELLPSLTDLDMGLSPDMQRMIMVAARRKVLSDEARARPGPSRCKKKPLSALMRAWVGAPCGECQIDWKTHRWLRECGISIVGREPLHPPPWHIHVPE